MKRRMKRRMTGGRMRWGRSSRGTPRAMARQRRESRTEKTSLMRKSWKTKTKKKKTNVMTKIRRTTRLQKKPSWPPPPVRPEEEEGEGEGGEGSR